MKKINLLVLLASAILLMACGKGMNTSAANTYSQGKEKGGVRIILEIDESEPSNQYQDTDFAKAMADAKEVLADRLDRFGVSWYNIQILDGNRRMSVEMSSEEDMARIRRLLQSAGNLEFLETYASQEVAPYIFRLDSELAALSSDNADAEKTTPESSAAGDHPLLSKLYGGGPRLDRGCIVLFAHEKDTAAINKMLHSDIAKNLDFPADLKFLWGAKPTDMFLGQKHIFELYAIRMTGDGDQAPIGGDVVKKAKAEFSQVNEKPVVTIWLNDNSARAWAEFTERNVGLPVVFVLDDLVYSAPVVMNKITGGVTQMSGNFTVEDTEDMANTLNSGRITVPLRIVEEDVIK